jgi:AcrR family transcriptional regulator
MVGAGTVEIMSPAFQQQIDERILDRAAALFARRGFAKTSVQAVADAVGLSKAGLLHHYPSKYALLGALLDRSRALTQEVLDEVGSLPVGAARDRLVIEILVDQALPRPGMVAFLLSFVTTLPAEELEPGLDLDLIDTGVFAAFGADKSGSAQERLIRITGAVAALSILALTTPRAGQTTTWRSHVVAASFDALGHSAGSGQSAGNGR